MRSTLLSRAQCSYICPSCSRSLKRTARKISTVVSPTPDIYDVVCVGGGPAGLGLLTALGSSKTTSNLSFALIESQDLNLARKWEPPLSQFSNRASSLTPSTLSFLQSIGAYDYLDHDRIQPYHHMHVWDALSPSHISFSNPPTRDSQEPLAHMTENPNLVRALLSRLDELQSTNFSVFDQTKVHSIDLGPPASPSLEDLDLSSYPHITLSSGQTLAARLLVGADGFNSSVRTFAGIQSRGWDYLRHGVVATVQLTSDVKNPTENVTAYQRFLPSGPIVLLALPGYRATLVWTCRPEQAARLKEMNPEDFGAMVDAGFRLGVPDIEYMLNMSSGQKVELDWRIQHTRIRTGDHDIPMLVTGVQEGSVASFPLRMRHADTYIGERIALIGDAAHTVHPLAGQGLNLGMGDVKSLAQTMKYAVAHGADIGVRGNLEAYESERYAANGRILGVCDKLHKLYSFKSAPVVGLRGLGLRAVNGIVPLKQFLMRQAAGVGVFT